MHRQLSSRITRLTAVALCLAASGVLAQGVTGSAITGTVTEEGAGPLAGATVLLRNPATGEVFAAVTGPSGEYFIDNVPAGGPYTLTAAAANHQANTQESLQLNLGQRLKADVALRPFGEEITVVARRDVLSDKGRTGPATALKAATITELPLQGRNFGDLLNTDPRVTGNSATGTSIGGQNNRFNNIQIDGGANHDLFGLAASGTPGGQANAKPLSIEAIQEFQVQVAPFDVRLGSFVGGLVNAVTKSGTNDFHGAVFGYNQNKGLANKSAYQLKSGQYVNDTDPTFLDYNTWQFGAALGGPIIKDKAHFFISDDFQTKTQAFGNSSQIGGVDANADRAKAGFDAATAQRFADLLASKYGMASQGNALAPNLGNPDKNVFVKVTTSAIENSHLEVSYNYVNANQDVLIRNPLAPSLPVGSGSGNLRDGYELSNSGYGQANTTNTARVKFTTNWDEGKFSNEFLAGLSIIRDERALPTDTPLVLARAGSVGASPSWLAAGGERFSQANTLDQDIYQLQDNVTWAPDWAKGQHRFTLGSSNEFFRFKNVFLQAATGVWAFDCINNTDCPAGDPHSLENGDPSAFQRRFGVSPLQDPGTATFRVAQWGFYAQDEWSPLDNLSVTPGLRIDVPFLSHANSNPALTTNAAFPLDTGKVPSGNILWSPRLGFNWDVDGQANTVVRGGVGIFSGRPPYVWVSNAYSINGLSQVQLTCLPPTGGSLPFKFTADPGKQPFSCTGSTTPPTAPVNQGEIDYFDPNT